MASQDAVLTQILAQLEALQVSQAQLQSKVRNMATMTLLAKVIAESVFIVRLARLYHISNISIIFQSSYTSKEDRRPTNSNPD